MFLLRYTNPYGEKHYLANLGLPWPHDLTKRLIERTVTRPEDARQFETEEEANTVLVSTGSPRGYEIVPCP